MAGQTLDYSFTLIVIYPQIPEKGANHLTVMGMIWRHVDFDAAADDNDTK